MSVTLGGVAGLIAAIAFLFLVGAVAFPLIRLTRVLDEVKASLQELTKAVVPVLAELENTVTATTDELGKLAVLTSDAAAVTSQAVAMTDNLARVTKLVSHTVAVPFIKLASVGRGARRAAAEWRKR